ncbi:MAG: hypothetical protein QM755_07055 [Luteolibacter sp.]
MNEPHRLRLRYFSFHESLPRWAYAFFSIPIVIGVAWPILAQAPIPPVLFLIVLPLIALTDREVEIDTVSRILVTRWMPYRLFTIWKTSEPLDRYEAVTSRRGSNGNRVSSPNEWEWIMLVRSNGKFRSIQYFHARKEQVCEEAQAAARRLMDATGLPFRSYPDKLLTRAAPGLS